MMVFYSIGNIECGWQYQARPALFEACFSSRYLDRQPQAQLHRLF